MKQNLKKNLESSQFYDRKNLDYHLWFHREKVDTLRHKVSFGPKTEILLYYEIILVGSMCSRVRLYSNLGVGIQREVSSRLSVRTCQTVYRGNCLELVHPPSFLPLVLFRRVYIKSIIYDFTTSVFPNSTQ